VLGLQICSTRLSLFYLAKYLGVSPVIDTNKSISFLEMYSISFTHHTYFISIVYWTDGCLL
jgi:hypothetical protein